MNILTTEEREELCAHLAHDIGDLNMRAERERNSQFKDYLIERAALWQSIIEKLERGNE